MPDGAEVGVILPGTLVLRSISHLKLGTKMVLLLWMTVAAMIAISAVGGFMLRQRMFDDRMEKIQAAVDSAVGIAGALEARVGAGTLTREQAQDLFHRDVRAIRFDGGTGYLTVLDTRTGTLVMHGVNPALEGKPTPLDAATKQLISVAIMQSVAASDTGFAPFMYPKPGHTEPLRKIAAVARFRPWDMVFYVGAYTDDLDLAFAAILFRLGAVGGSVLLLTVIGGWLVTRDITGSLGGLKSAMERLSQGDLSTVVPGTNRRDEVGGMAATVLVFRERVAEAGQLRGGAGCVEGAGRGRSVRGTEPDGGWVRDTDRPPGRDAIVRVSAALESTARSLTTAAAEGSQQATSVAAAAEQAGASLHAVGPRERGTDRLDQRDQPAGGAHRPRSPARRWTMPNAPTRSCMRWPTVPRRSARWSA